jgi:inosine-uridine nucleoside N-ribohydrolase
MPSETSRFCVLVWIILFGGISINRLAIAADPLPVIFDTDMGNDIDDVFAMGVLHALHSHRECRILAVTVSKDHELAAPFCDVLNTFYGHGEIPIGVMRTDKPSDAGPYLAQVMAPGANGEPPFPHRLRKGSDAPLAVSVFRRALASQADGSVTVIAIGPMTNLADVLDSAADEYSPLMGRQLVAAKVGRMVVMAGDFSKPKAEFNVFVDPLAAKKVFEGWPGPIVACPFEMGEAIHYPEWSLEQDFRISARHPLIEANLATFGKLNGFMAWDLVATLYAVRPDREYFQVSGAGMITLDEEGVTHFAAEPTGKHRYLMPGGNIERANEALATLASQPPP